ncbi:SDR family NAD(P)-dependent oxidoreductase [Paenibacillus yanchengensis]|uniref:SDR family NAD(P)-dependent oxidoreductase n=1 Tax=Paenibacillus yanchengensis TaxID=2035833 RepID=A0ABW4YQ72_9BACL
MNILITGANRGLGLALLTESLERGHQVWATVRADVVDGSDLQQLQKKYTNHLNIVKLDVLGEASVQTAAEQLRQNKVILDCIINNAAIVLGRSSTLEQVDLNDVAHTMDVNLYGPIRILKHFSSLLVQDKSPIVINISSASGSYDKAYGGDYPYAISKAALNFFNYQLRLIERPYPIQAFAIHPGWLKTDMGGEAAPTEPHDHAPAIIDMAEGKSSYMADTILVDHRGDPLPN